MKTPMIDLVYKALLAVEEGNGIVYLDNVNLDKLGISKHQFAGYLSGLTKAGRYRPLDDFFGEVIW